MLSCLVACLPSPAKAQGVGIAVKAGTPGIGADLTLGITSWLNVRAGGGLFTYKRTMTEQDITYDAKAKLANGLATLDIHPGGGAFRLSLGAAWNGNRLTGNSVGGTVVVNGITYRVQDVGVISAEAKGKTLCPYAGIGFGNAVSKGSRIGFVLDIGAYYMGSPTVSLTANPTNPALVPPGFYQNLEQERRKVEDQASKYKYYPIVSLGISVRL